MSHLTKSMAILSGCIILSSAVLHADDWPQWMGANRDAKVANFKAPAAWPATITPKWKTTVGAGDSTPALVKGKLYAFGRQVADEVTTCLDAATGKELWNEKCPAPAVSGPSARAHAGPRSSPLVTDGHVITLGASGILSCLNADSGKMEWRKDDIKTFPQYYVSMSPIVVDGMVIAHLGTRGSGALQAYDLKTGDVKWKWTADGPAYASPVLLTVAGVKQIVTMTEANIVGINAADGKLLWQTPFAVTGMAYNAATPIVDGATVIFTGQTRGTTAIKVEKSGDTFKTTQLWKSTVGTQFNTPVLKDGLLYGLSDSGKLFCLKASDGTTAWTDATARGTNYGSIVDAGTTLIALTSNADLIAYKPSDKAFDKIAQLKTGTTNTDFAYPVIDGNKIYLRDDSSISLLVLE